MKILRTSDGNAGIITEGVKPDTARVDLAGRATCRSVSLP